MNNSDVWQLETSLEEQACNEVNEIYRRAKEERSIYARNLLKRIFENSWETIKERFETESSAWYVWYMDGVREYIKQYFPKETK
jgi:hypothetical protein